jgi:hypothetical protein
MNLKCVSFWHSHNGGVKTVEFDEVVNDFILDDC